jgi:two-component system chemotaxis sensor kinase CheA
MMDTAQYLDMFLDESREYVQTMNDGLLILEKQPEDTGVVQEIFRAAHTLKGMSATMGFSNMAELTHQLENVLDAVRNGGLAVTSEVVDVLLEGADELEAVVDDIAAGGNDSRDIEMIVSNIQKCLGKTDDAELAPTHGSFQLNEYEKTVITQAREQGLPAFRIRVVLRSDCLLKAARVFMVFEVLESVGEVIQSLPSVEELEKEAFEREFSVVLISKEKQEILRKCILKVSEGETVDVEEINGDFQESRESTPIQKIPKNDSATSPNLRQGSKTIRVNVERLDKLMNLFEEFVIDRARLVRISEQMQNNDLTKTVERITRTSADMREMIISLRMVPIEQVFRRFPKMVRDLARSLNKNVRLNISGGETELDRTVIDEIGDPLVHLLRNSLDHGIESPEIREANGKPHEGIVDLKAYYSGNHVFIEITDDGAGINRKAVLDKALTKSVITETEAEKLTDKEVYELLFSSGFSTAETISDISGRGVGLDVVKNKIESLGGRVEVDSTPGKGTTFTIRLPLTLSIIMAMMVESGQEIYAIPLSSIIEVARVPGEDILTLHKQQMIDFRGKMVPLVWLREMFAVPERKNEKRSYFAVIIQKGDKLAGLIVDSLIGYQEIVLKSLGNYLTDIFGISGATILGDGQVALVIDCNSLFQKTPFQALYNGDVG